MTSSDMKVLRLPDRLSSALGDLFASGPPGDRDLQTVYCLGKAHRPIDHARHAVAFAYLYFGANYAKAYHATASSLRLRDPIRLLDLGTGAGASTCGIIQACIDKGVPIRDVCVVEASREELRLFERIAVPWIREALPRATFTSVEDDAARWLRRERPRWDLVVASYLFCEMSPAKRAELGEELERLCGETRFLIVDAYEDKTSLFDPCNGTWRAIDVSRLKIELPFLGRTAFTLIPPYS